MENEVKNDTTTQEDKLFSENKKGTSKDMIQKVMIVIITLLFLLFVLVVNCNKKKGTSGAGKTTEQKQSSSEQDESTDSVELYEEQLHAGNKNTADEWSKSKVVQAQESIVPIENRPVMVSGGNQTVTADGQVSGSNQNVRSTQYSTGSGSGQYNGTPVTSAPPQPYKYNLPNAMKKRLDDDYTRMVEHFRGSRDKAKWVISDDEYKQLTSGKGNLMNAVDKPLQNLYDNAGEVASVLTTRIPAGSRILATLDQDVSSDHPGVFTATVVRPFEIKGYKLICQSGTNARDRITVTVQKIISTSNKEFTLEGQVQNGYPGLTGKVTNHFMKRMGPALVNAAIGGGFLAWSLKGGDQGRVDTRDAIVSGVVEQSVSGVQNEVSRLGGDFPNTVLVKQGTQFEILITSEVAVQ